jgi:hypothetical protein
MRAAKESSFAIVFLKILTPPSLLERPPQFASAAFKTSLKSGANFLDADKKTGRRKGDLLGGSNIMQASRKASMMRNTEETSQQTKWSVD